MFDLAQVTPADLVMDLGSGDSRTVITAPKRGTRVVSNSFDMKDWRPEQTVEAQGECSSYCRAHLWIVPAKVEGTWKLPDGELRLEQTYQMLLSTLRTGNTTMSITDGKVIGETISYVAGDRRYTGRVTGNAITGISQTAEGFRATRGN